MVNPTTYTAKTISGANLIANGNFETVLTDAQAQALTPDYIYKVMGTPGVGVDGQFSIGFNPQTFYDGSFPGYPGYWFNSLTDHTTGSGKMFFANGNNIANKVVYRTTVSVTNGIV